MVESKQIDYYNEDDKAVPKEEATRFMITYTDSKGKFLRDEWGILPTPAQRKLMTDNGQVFRYPE